MSWRQRGVFKDSRRRLIIGPKFPAANDPYWRRGAFFIRAQHELLREFQAVVESNVEAFTDRERVDKLLATAAENTTVSATGLGESTEGGEPRAEQKDAAEPETVTST